MTDYVPIPDASTQIGKPVTSNLIRQLLRNFIAMFEGNSAAPKLWAQALRYQDFTASGTFEVPQACTKVFVEVVGGGGGGASGITTALHGGGSAGGRARGWLDVVPGDLIAVTIGAGGTGGTGGADNATSGGTSSFGSLMSATGGLRGRVTTAFSTFRDVLVREALHVGGVGVGGQWNDRGSGAQITDNGDLAPCEGGLGVGAVGGSNALGTPSTPGAGGRSGSYGSTSNAGQPGASGIVRVWY